MAGIPIQSDDRTYMSLTRASSLHGSTSLESHLVGVDSRLCLFRRILNGEVSMCGGVTFDSESKPMWPSKHRKQQTRLTCT